MAHMKYLSTLGPAAKLRLYHEVTVARADEQFFEYLAGLPPANRNVERRKRRIRYDRTNLRRGYSTIWV